MRPTQAGTQPWPSSAAIREALRRDQFAPAARGGECGVVVQQVWIMHRMDPAPDVIIGNGFADGRGLHRLAEILVDVGAVERACVHGRNSVLIGASSTIPAAECSGEGRTP